MTTVTKERPAGVTILALLWLSAGAFYAFGTLIQGARVLNPLAGLLINPLAGIFVIAAVAIALVQGGLFVAIGFGLLKMQNWARVLLIVLSGIILLGGVLGLMISVMHADVSGLWFRVVAIVIAVSMLVYFLKPRVKEAFGATRF